MGTVFSFDVRGDSGPRTRTALAAATVWLHHVDEEFSPYRPGSQLSRLARGELAPDDCSPEVREVLRLCADAERRSGGWFSARYAGGLDPTGLVKGWAVERAAAMLRSAGAPAVCVNGGGDVQLHGGPWRVGVADPLRPGAVVTVVEARHTLAVATSGPAERGCHILDPHTGAPPADALASVTVLARGLTDADAWATAACAMGADRARGWLEELPGAEAFAVTSDGGTWQTRGFARSRLGETGAASGRTG
ncbi:FAD:protein FMN transferase [Streptomyces sp. RKAG293]|uniref:FAD:protein FMN transferase n=1 Tax=Streptomyces sp. RKAG293 TaxID=2893403 RepID=UPI0020345A21|nr:FAD:protein FMN transferase [Streptomyces sp. RKAG293]MCM2417322.1 FAD:protein FMN transferase [Streptomyces sp. RKAG293]